MPNKRTRSRRSGRNDLELIDRAWRYAAGKTRQASRYDGSLICADSRFAHFQHARMRTEYSWQRANVARSSFLGEHRRFDRHRNPDASRQPAQRISHRSIPVCRHSLHPSQRTPNPVREADRRRFSIAISFSTSWTVAARKGRLDSRSVDHRSCLHHVHVEDLFPADVAISPNDRARSLRRP
jgi:hypothetical protein